MQRFLRNLILRTTRATTYLCCVNTSRAKTVLSRVKLEQTCIVVLGIINLIDRRTDTGGNTCHDLRKILKCCSKKKMYPQIHGGIKERPLWIGDTLPARNGNPTCVGIWLHFAVAWKFRLQAISMIKLCLTFEDHLVSNLVRLTPCVCLHNSVRTHEHMA